MRQQAHPHASFPDRPDTHASGWALARGRGAAGAAVRVGWLGGLLLADYTRVHLRRKGAGLHALLSGGSRAVAACQRRRGGGGGILLAAFPTLLTGVHASQHPLESFSASWRMIRRSAVFQGASRSQSREPAAPGMQLKPHLSCHFQRFLTLSRSHQPHRNPPAALPHARSPACCHQTRLLLQSKSAAMRTLTCLALIAVLLAALASPAAAGRELQVCRLFKALSMAQVA